MADLPTGRQARLGDIKYIRNIEWRGGGIGRHAAFRSLCLQKCVGSTPTRATKTEIIVKTNLICCFLL